MKINRLTVKRKTKTFKIDSYIIYVCFLFRFIGELFQLKLLSQNIMHDCVLRLLQHRDPEYLEGLCTLLKTVGKEIDTDKAKV